VIVDAERASDDEEHGAHQVNEELQNGQIGAQQVGEEDGGNDDGVAHECTHAQEVVSRAVAQEVLIAIVPAETSQ